MKMRDLMDLVETAIRPNMLNLFKILNQMVTEGAISAYALCGAMAAFEYIEVATTEDVDVTVHLPGAGLLVTLDPITAFLQRHGLPVTWKGEGLLIEGYPVQFITDGDPLDASALEHCRTVVNSNVPIHVWRIEHLMAKCLQIGRPKDQARLAAFLEVEYDAAVFCGIVKQFGLSERWTGFCTRFGIDDVCGSADNA